MKFLQGVANAYFSEILLSRKQFDKEALQYDAAHSTMMVILLLGTLIYTQAQISQNRAPGLFYLEVHKLYWFLDCLLSKAIGMSVYILSIFKLAI